MKNTGVLEQKISDVHESYTKQLKKIEDYYISKINKIRDNYG